MIVVEQLGLILAVLLLKHTVFIAVGEHNLVEVFRDPHFQVLINLIHEVYGGYRLKLLAVIDRLIFGSKLDVLHKIKDGDLLDIVPQASHYALIIAVVRGLEAHVADLIIDPRAYRVDSAIASLNVENENLGAAVSDQESLLLIELNVLDEGQVEGTIVEVEQILFFVLLCGLNRVNEAYEVFLVTVYNSYGLGIFREQAKNFSLMGEFHDHIPVREVYLCHLVK